MDVLMDDTMYTLFWLCAIIALCFLLYFVRRQKKKEQGSKVRAVLVTVECVKPTAGLEAEYTVCMKYRVDDKGFCCYKPKLEKTVIVPDTGLDTSEIAIHCEEWSCETQSVCSIAVEEEEYRINRLTASNGVIGTLPFPDVYVTLNNVVIPMQVDSGASLTIISEHTFK
ncbi:Ribonuclease [Trichinella spiralis]|uniref:Ribonuclease n=1 Tax=Trichinella spiralis TaxID=6334 RepID=A0ABR3K740_TRISP